ncbi:E3 ubiquitin-protein ligase Topors [Willisornis vidua]|uniref:RING-type E3 ubiquitin transferase n=1 Tax=Willisornis vidua TaxID=1566151 RepID=A0ABQ9D9M7_9PASS|nr:E3 ubiquitin-protein ligase Topors [Willisornis vidua]
MNDKKISRSSQHGFTKRKSCLINLIIYKEMNGLVDRRRPVVIVFLDFSKASDTVSHKVLIDKQLMYGLVQVVPQTLMAFWVARAPQVWTLCLSLACFQKSYYSRTAIRMSVPNTCSEGPEAAQDHKVVPYNFEMPPKGYCKYPYDKKGGQIIVPVNGVPTMRAHCAKSEQHLAWALENVPTLPSSFRKGFVRFCFLVACVDVLTRSFVEPLLNMTPADKEFAEDSNFAPKAGTSKLPTDASPDSKCPICLDRFDNVAYLDCCLHRFCFRCVQEWSKNKAECPLCKQPFFSIFHTIRAEDDFKEYVLSPLESSSFASPDGRRFRYRTTLTRERRTRGSPSQRMLSPPDNGMLFEGLSSEPVRHRHREIQQMIRRLASRRQASAEGRSLRQIQEEDMINFRRALYRTGVRIRSIQDGGRYRDISAEFFRRNPACLHRLVPWLKRELTVLFGAHGSLINIVQHIIMSNVTRYDLESQAFADDLKPFLLNRTEHFLHEFISFARCPFNLEAYDQHANYDCPAPSYEEGSHSDSSIITISPDVSYSQGPDNSLSVPGLGQAPWDDETPGPSYSISEEVRTTIASPLESSESSDEDSATGSRRTKLQTQLQANADSNDSGSSSDNCVIVGYVKPLAERTPEVVELSSDSEESIREEKREDVKKQQPVQCHSWSDSERSRSFSPGSPTYKEDVGSCRSCLSTEKTESKEDEKKKYCLERESPEAHSPVHRTVEAVMAIGLEGSTVAKANLKRDDREAERAANIGAKEAAEGQGLMTTEPL